MDRMKMNEYSIEAPQGEVRRVTLGEWIPPSRMYVVSASRLGPALPWDHKRYQVRVMAKLIAAL